MHGWMTSRHEGCVSTMLTGSNFSIALSVRHFKGLYDEMDDARRKARHLGVLSVLTRRQTSGHRNGRLATILWAFHWLCRHCRRPKCIERTHQLVELGRSEQAVWPAWRHVGERRFIEPAGFDDAVLRQMVHD